MLNQPKSAQYLLALIVTLVTGSLSQAGFSAEPEGDPAPFPAGPNAMLVKQTCSQCHSPNVVVTQTFSEETARKIYRKMMGESPDTERGKKIVEYLVNVLGENDDDDED
jgi:hypothetical protein